MSQQPIYYFRVSSLSHAEICPKRSKIEVFTKFNNKFVSGTISKGNKMHYELSHPLVSFDRARCRYLLGITDYNGNATNKVFTKQIDYVQIRGQTDNLFILSYHNQKYTVLKEYKTTSKPYMWSLEIKSAIRQLQLYMFVMKDALEKAGYPLWRRGYLEIYSQQTGNLMRRIPVEYDYNIEDWIRNVIDQFRGQSRVRPPPFSYCRLCPKQVKLKCSWFEMRNKKELC